MVGGIPLYIEQLDSARTAEWNIANRLLGPGRFLYAEPSNFLLQEVSSPAPYTAVVDVVALGSDGELVCGECRWKADPVGADVVETLHYRSRLVTENPATTSLYVFSKTGFADSARREAARLGNVTLFSMEEMF